jgi:hypothetical protein
VHIEASTGDQRPLGQKRGGERRDLPRLDLDLDDRAPERRPEHGVAHDGRSLERDGRPIPQGQNEFARFARLRQRSN